MRWKAETLLSLKILILWPYMCFRPISGRIPARSTMNRIWPGNGRRQDPQGWEALFGPKTPPNAIWRPYLHSWHHFYLENTHFSRFSENSKFRRNFWSVEISARSEISTESENRDSELCKSGFGFFISFLDHSASS